MKKEDIIQLVKEIMAEIKADHYGSATLTTQGQYKSRFTKTGKPPGIMLEANPLSKIIGSRPYSYVGGPTKGQYILSGPMNDREKTELIKKAEEAGYIAKPNMGGGVTIFLRPPAVMNEISAERIIGVVSAIFELEDEAPALATQGYIKA